MLSVIMAALIRACPKIPFTLGFEIVDDRWSMIDLLAAGWKSKIDH